MGADEPCSGYYMRVQSTTMVRTWYERGTTVVRPMSHIVMIIMAVYEF